MFNDFIKTLKWTLGNYRYCWLSSQQLFLLSYQKSYFIQALALPSLSWGNCDYPEPILSILVPRKPVLVPEWVYGLHWHHQTGEKGLYSLSPARHKEGPVVTKYHLAPLRKTGLCIKSGRMELQQEPEFSAPLRTAVHCTWSLLYLLLY